MSNLDQSRMKTETATLGNGCFWCTEAIFQQVMGVLTVTSGYSGGQTINPNYASVCTGTTGHAECLQIEFNPAMISFESLLEVFFTTHDPTTLNRQGNDVGTQYRSVIFYHNENQRAISVNYMADLEKSRVFKGPIVTTLEPFHKFYPAENYHQDYYNLNQTAPYCRYVVRPKLEKFNQSLKNRFGKK